MQRYSFNDITPFSLQWDDLISKDGGKTWSKNWVIEWTRRVIDPDWPIDDEKIPTYVDGSLCDDGSFRPYEAIAGHWQGSGARLDAYRILDGCAVMAFLEEGDRKEFLFLTYLTGPKRGDRSPRRSSRNGTGPVLERSGLAERPDRRWRNARLVRR